MKVLKRKSEQTVWRYFFQYFFFMFLSMFSFQCVWKLRAAGLSVSSIIWEPLVVGFAVAALRTFKAYDEAE